MQRIAIIDIGSNSARLVISHIYKSGAYNMVYNQKEALRLSQKVDGSNLLTEEAFSSTLECMKSFAYMCDIYRVDKTIAVATAAIRNAKNGEALTKKVFEETGIKLHIISGKTEAYISYLGVINTLNVKDGIIFDLGGGSTELILFKNREIVDSVSLPCGAVNTTTMFNTRNQLPNNVYSDLSFFITSRLDNYPWVKEGAGLPLIGVGGTARTIAKIIQRAKKYPATKLHNYSYSVQTFRGFFGELRNTNLEQRKKISGLSSERSDIILAGASIVNCLVNVTGCGSIITSGCGLREGLFYDYYSKTNNVPLIAPDILERSRENILKLYIPDEAHSRHITKLALTMFDGWKELHHLRSGYRRLLETAALLHDIGININFYSHARHSAYMIQNAKLFGLTHKEQIFTSAIAGWHNGVSKNYFKDRFYKDMLTDSNWQAINKLSLILALAESLDYTQTKQIKAVETTCQKKVATLGIYSDNLPSIELHQLQSQLSWFKKAMDAELKIELLDKKPVQQVPAKKAESKKPAPKKTTVKKETVKKETIPKKAIVKKAAPKKVAAPKKEKSK